MRDSYERFLSAGYISKEKLFDFGIRETIFAPIDKAEEEWVKLKEKIKNNETIYIRAYGRNGEKSPLLLNMYKSLLNNCSIEIDKTNNDAPTKLIESLSGHSKKGKVGYIPIRNYQVSHVFGKTKNVYAFTAPWNIAYIPKIIDPFTGHEAHGEIVNEYQTLFQRECINQFKHLIQDYNNLMKDVAFQTKIESYLKEITNNNQLSLKDLRSLTKTIKEDFSTISTDI